jgi:hypothetical protein
MKKFALFFFIVLIIFNLAGVIVNFAWKTKAAPAIKPTVMVKIQATKPYSPPVKPIVHKDLPMVYADEKQLWLAQLISKNLRLAAWGYNPKLGLA